jgi:hypothetical protein
MPKLLWFDGDAPRQPIYYVQPRRTYGFFRFMWDLFLICITGGFWLIWIFVREMRRR